LDVRIRRASSVDHGSRFRAPGWTEHSTGDGTLSPSSARFPPVPASPWRSSNSPESERGLSISGEFVLLSAPSSKIWSSSLLLSTMENVGEASNILSHYCTVVRLKKL